MERVQNCAHCGADQDGGLEGACWQCGTPWDEKPERSRTRLAGCAAFTCGEYDRSYGGPEEGGWYYDDFRPLRVLIVPASKAARCERLLKRWEERNNEGRPSVSSVLSRGRYRYEAGIVPATPRPHYE